MALHQKLESQEEIVFYFHAYSEEMIALFCRISRKQFLAC